MVRVHMCVNGEVDLVRVHMCVNGEGVRVRCVKG